MATVSKKGNGGKKKKRNSNQSQKLKVKMARKPQSEDARKMKNVNYIQGIAALSWTSDDDDKDSGCSLNQDLSNQDKANSEAARTRLADWIASIQTLVRQSGPSKVNPSPHPMQQLNSNVGNVWSNSLFGHLHKEGLDFTTNTNKSADKDDVIKITSEDVDPEIKYWQSAIVCYILGVKPPFRIIEGFIRRVWGKYGVVKVAMMNNGVFVVRFKTVEDKMKGMQGGSILYDRKPVIMQE